MRILVTGSNGQLGSDIRALASDYTDFEFLFTDIEELDITDPFKVEAYCVTNQPQVIINCAAYTAVDKAESDEDTAYLINAAAVQNLSESAARIDALVVQISTDYVFNGMSHIPYTETDKTNPQSVYGKSKLAGENAVRKHAGKAVIIRTSWLYSTFGNNFVKTIIRYGKERAELNVVFDQVGTPTYSRDLARVILDIIPLAIKQPGINIYHYSNEGVASWFDFAHTIITQCGISCEIKPTFTKDLPLHAHRPCYSVLNKSKIKETFNITIPYWRDSVIDCILKLEQQTK